LPYERLEIHCGFIRGNYPGRGYVDTGEFGRSLTLGRNPTHNGVLFGADRRLETRRGVARTKRIQLQDGSYIDAEIVPFRGDVEHWNEYLLDDGTVLRMKSIVREVVRLDGHYDAEGNPAYIVDSANVTHVSAPEDLKRREG